MWRSLDIYKLRLLLIWAQRADSLGYSCTHNMLTNLHKKLHNFKIGLSNPNKYNVNLEDEVFELRFQIHPKSRLVKHVFKLIWPTEVYKNSQKSFFESLKNPIIWIYYTKWSLTQHAFSKSIQHYGYFFRLEFLTQRIYKSQLTIIIGMSIS